MANKKKLKMGQFAYDLKTNKAVFKIGTETYDVFPIDTKLSETSNNPVSNAVITKKIKEIEEGGGSGYVLPPATAEKLGGIKVGEGLTIASDGTLSAHGGGTPITIDKALDKTSENAIANKPVAEKFEQINKAIEDIVPYELPKASTEILGGIKIGQNLTIDENGVLSAIGGEASSADKVTYDNISSKIEATNVQEAIDYLVEQSKEKEEITSKIYTTAAPGIIDQSSYLNDNFAGYQAFNGQSATISTCQGGWLSTAEDTTPWISYNFEQKVILTKIVIEACNNSTTISKDYKVQGSLEGVIYEDITEITITFEQGKLTPYIFNINSNKEYQYFRILGSSPNYGGINLYACTFSQIKLYAKKGQGEKDTPIAADVAYDDSVSSIGVTNVQEAIDYLVKHGGGGGSGGDYSLYFLEHEYFNCNNTGYITNIPLNSNYTIEVKFDGGTFKSNATIFGNSNGSSGNAHLTEFNSKWYVGGNGESSFGTYSAGIHTFVYNGENNNCYMDGVLGLSNIGQITSDTIFYTIACRGDITSNTYNGKIYYMQFTDKSSNTIIHLLKPCSIAIKVKDKYIPIQSGLFDMITDEIYNIDNWTFGDIVKATPIRGGSSGDLQPATTETLGGIIVGDNLEITKEGILSAIAAPYDLPIASNEVLGGIKVGQNLTIDENGILNAEAGGASSATDVTYDDTITQIGVNNVQAAIEYLKVHGGGGTSADFYTYDETMAILNEKSGGDEPDMICGIFSDVEEAYIIEESVLGIFKEETENE